VAHVKSNKAFVALELADNHIRIAALIGTPSPKPSGRSRTIRCDRVDIPDIDEFGPVTLPSASELASTLKPSLARLGVTGGQASISIAADRMVLRYFTGTESQVRSELREAAERSVKYVQLGIGDRVVAESTLRLDDGRLHAVFAVASAATIDPLVKAVEQLGLRVRIVEPSLVSLLRLTAIDHYENPGAAILIHADTGGMELGIALDDQLVFSRRVSASRFNDNDSPSEEPDFDLPREIAKASRHYLHVHGATDNIRRVILFAGSERQSHYLHQLNAVAQEFQVEAHAFSQLAAESLDIDHEDAANADEHSSAIGALAGLLGVNNVTGPNLVSESQSREQSAVETLARSLIIPTIVAFSIWATTLLAGGHLASASADLRAQLDLPSAIATQYRESQLDLARLEQRSTYLGALVAQFSERDWKAFLDMVRICVPQGLWLSRIHVTNTGHIAIEGAAYRESLIYEFSEYLAKSPLFHEATIVTTTATRYGNSFVTEFSLECSFSRHNEQEETPTVGMNTP